MDQDKLRIDWHKVVSDMNRAETDAEAAQLLAAIRGTAQPEPEARYCGMCERTTEWLLDGRCVGCRDRQNGQDWAAQEEAASAWASAWAVNSALPNSGQQRQFSTGSRRDCRTGKGRYDLLPWSMVKRWALRMEAGAAHYGERNWELGQPLDSYYDSAIRHLAEWLAGDRSEDHLAAALFNVGAIGWTEEQIDVGNLPESLRGQGMPNWDGVEDGDWGD